MIGFGFLNLLAFVLLIVANPTILFQCLNMRLFIVNFRFANRLLARMLDEAEEGLSQMLILGDIQNEAVVVLITGQKISKRLLNYVAVGLMRLHPSLIKPDDVFDNILGISEFDFSVLGFESSPILFLHDIFAEVVLLGWQFLNLIIGDIITLMIVIIAQTVEDFNNSVLKVYFCQFGDCFLAARCEMVHNLNALSFLGGELNLQMVRVGEAAVAELKELFEVSRSRLLRVQDVPDLLLGFLLHPLNINYELTLIKTTFFLLFLSPILRNQLFHMPLSSLLL